MSDTQAIGPRALGCCVCVDVDVGADYSPSALAAWRRDACRV
jgi:hypothetical protein